MSVRADFHVHTTFCDGAAAPREMAEAALSAGLTALGFSGHSFVPFDPSCGMDAETAARYRAEIHALRGEYAGGSRSSAASKRTYTATLTPRLTIT